MTVALAFTRTAGCWERPSFRRRLAEALRQRLPGQQSDGRVFTASDLEQPLTTWWLLVLQLGNSRDAEIL